MSIKRRQFLLLSSLSGFGVFVAKRVRTEIAPNRNNKPQLDTELAKRPEKKPLLRFIAVADTGTGTKSQYAVADAMTRYHQKNPFDLAILAGDNIYTNGEFEKIGEVFERPYQRLLQQGVKFHACLGNHDIRTDNGDRQVSYPNFNMKGRYYSFRRGPVQFFALDTNNNADWKKQLDWLEKELSRSKSPWKVVFGHHQIYSSGIYGLNEPFIEILPPLFKKYKVQLWINGHDHHYERSKPINGTTYLICGAGSSTRPVGSSEWTAHSASKLSFAAIEVYADTMNINGIDTANSIFDRGVVQLNSF